MKKLALFMAIVSMSSLAIAAPPGKSGPANPGPSNNPSGFDQKMAETENKLKTDYDLDKTKLDAQYQHAKPEMQQKYDAAKRKLDQENAAAKQDLESMKQKWDNQDKPQMKEDWQRAKQQINQIQSNGDDDTN